MTEWHGDFKTSTRAHTALLLPAFLSLAEGSSSGWEEEGSRDPEIAPSGSKQCHGGTLKTDILFQIEVFLGG